MKIIFLGLILSSFSAFSIDYKDHDVGLINKHAGEFEEQGDFDNYLDNFYIHVSGIIAERYKDRAAYIVTNTKNVNRVKNKVTTDGSADHVLAIYQHKRPAIYRSWEKQE